MANTHTCPTCGRSYRHRRHDRERCWARTWIRLLVEAGLVERGR